MSNNKKENIFISIFARIWAVWAAVSFIATFLIIFIPSMIPFLFSTIGAGTVFLIFAVMMVFQLLFVIFMMPETKGKSLEELQQTTFKS